MARADASADGQPSISRQLAARLHQAMSTGLPDDVRAAARVLMADTFFVALAGAHGTDVQAVTALAAEQGGRADSQVWGSEHRLPAPEAAFINTLAASALDYDSLHDNVHPDAITLSAAMAVAQRQGRSGRDMQDAFALGSELVCRLAEAAIGPQKGWTIGAVLGTFGAAASASLLLGLSEQQTSHALGLCLSMAAGSQQSNVEKVLAKRLQPALAARSGVQAALLAGAGMTAPAEVFEGRFGLWSLYFPGDAEHLLDGFAERYALKETGLKLYPICACSHAPMQALLGLMRDETFDAADVRRVEAVISPFMDRLVGGPFEPAANPQVTAQFCLRYALAKVLTSGGFALADLEDQAVLDPAIVPWTSLVDITIDAANQGELAPATIGVSLHDGRRLERTVRHLPGSPPWPLDASQRSAKFEACAFAASGQAPARALALKARIESLVAGIENVVDARTLAV